MQSDLSSNRVPRLEEKVEGESFWMKMCQSADNLGGRRSRDCPSDRPANQMSPMLNLLHMTAAVKNKKNC